MQDRRTALKVIGATAAALPLGRCGAAGNVLGMVRPLIGISGRRWPASRLAEHIPLAMHAATFDRGVTWAALGADALVSWHLTKRLALDLRLGGLAPLRRPTFVVNSATTGAERPVHRPASLTFVGLLGAEVRFF